MTKAASTYLIAFALFLTATNVYMVVKLHDLGHQVGVAQSRAKHIEDCLYVKRGFKIYRAADNWWYEDGKPVCRFEK